MDFAQQSPRAADAHGRILGTGEATCIDCHAGIAHTLPKMAVENAALDSGFVHPAIDPRAEVEGYLRGRN
jgi:cytochrome c-type protein NapC